MHMATVLLMILAAGLSSQWLAWRFQVPAIVIQIGMPQAELAELIGLGVAIILFEGGMDLKASEFRRVGHGIGRLTVLGPPLAWLLGGLAAHYIAGLSWPVAWVLGAILVVTGPTVILPLLRQARLNKDSAALLKWRGWRLGYRLAFPARLHSFAPQGAPAHGAGAGQLLGQQPGSA